MSPRLPLAFLLTLAALLGGLLAGSQTTLKAYASGRSAYENLDTLARALAQIEVNYVEDTDPTNLIYGAIEGMTLTLDPHTRFYDPESYRTLLRETEGNYFGIGIEVTLSPEGGLLVVDVIEGGPALAAGVQTGDRIVEVDGQDITAQVQSDIIERIRGPKGETVSLGLIREDRQITLEVVRDKIHSASVRGELVEPGVAYVIISQFRREAAKELALELRRLSEGHPLESIVLDVRANPGGLLEEAVAVVDLFVSEGRILTTEGRVRGAMEEHIATDSVTDYHGPLFVLVDKGTASAAEILAGALQDMERATLIGQPTYGKGSVQSLFEYEDGSALKMTIARYHLPSGRAIERDGGIQPDELVRLRTEESDPIAALEERITNLPLSDGDRDLFTGLINRLRATGDPRPSFRGPLEARLNEDEQLDRAVDRALAARP